VWARAAWAALCATITVCGGVHVALRQPLALTHELKPCSLSVSENVAILDFPPTVDACGTRLQLRLFPVREYRYWNIQNGLASRGQRLDPKWGVTGDVGKIMPQRPLATAYARSKDHINCRTLPEILDADLHNPFPVVADIFDVSVFDMNISPKLALGIFLDCRESATGDLSADLFAALIEACMSLD
jgi:hypothetical protein